MTDHLDRSPSSQKCPRCGSACYYSEFHRQYACIDPDCAWASNSGTNDTRAWNAPLPQTCEFCGDQGPLLLQARCHLTAPLQVTLDGDELILRCYVPDCAREVARFKIVRRLATP